MLSQFDRPLLITAHSLINLWATGYIEPILQSLKPTKAVPSCLMREPNELERLPGDDYQILRANLEGLVDSQSVILVSPETDAEWTRFFEISSNSRTKQKQSQHVVCAIALERTWAIVSDEPIMRIFGQKYSPPTPVVPALSLVYHWQTTSSVSKSVLYSALLQAKTRVHLCALPGDSLFDWWTSILVE